LVDYHYGFSGDLGGGPYRRDDAVTEVLTTPVRWQVTWLADVQKARPATNRAVLRHPARSDRRLERPAGGTEGVIVILDSQTYDLTRCRCPPSRSQRAAAS